MTLETLVVVTKSGGAKEVHAVISTGTSHYPDATRTFQDIYKELEAVKYLPSMTEAGWRTLPYSFTVQWSIAR